MVVDFSSASDGNQTPTWVGGILSQQQGASPLWNRISAAGTVSSGTGPPSAHDGNYLYIEGSNPNQDWVYVLNIHPECREDLEAGKNYLLTFTYHEYVQPNTEFHVIRHPSSVTFESEDARFP